MRSDEKDFFGKRPFLAALLGLLALLLFLWVEIAEAPPAVGVTTGAILLYHIDESGRIMDRDGRLRGWILGNEVFDPAMEPKYRFTGKVLSRVR